MSMSMPSTTTSRPYCSSASNSPSLTLSIQLSSSSNISPHKNKNKNKNKNKKNNEEEEEEAWPEQSPPPPPLPLEFLPLRPSPREFAPSSWMNSHYSPHPPPPPSAPDSFAAFPPLRGCGAIIDMNQIPSTTSSDSDDDDIDLSSSVPPHLRLSSVRRRLPQLQHHPQQQDYYYHPHDPADLAKPCPEASPEHIYMERIRHEALFPACSDEEDGGVGSVRKKLRLSKEQSAVLEESFKEHSTLNPKQKNALAKQLNLRPRQVEVWFQNRRARTKLKQTEVDCKLLKRCCESLTEENRRLQREVAELRAMKVGGGGSPACTVGGHDFYKMNKNSSRGMAAAPPPPAAAATLTMCPCCEQLATTTPHSSSSANPAATTTSSSSAAAAAAAGGGAVTSNPNPNFPFIPKPYFPLSSISPQQQSSAAC